MAVVLVNPGSASAYPGELGDDVELVSFSPKEWARLDGVTDVEVDASGNIYVVEAEQSSVSRFSPDGEFQIRWGVFGNGTENLMYPESLAIAPSGDVYVSDTRNGRVQVFSPDGEFLFGFGQGILDEPVGIEAAADGTVYVADSYHDAIRHFSADGALLDSFGETGSDPGQLYNPRYIAIDDDERLVVTDLLTRQYDASPRVQTFTADGDYVSGFEVSFLGSGAASPQDVEIGPDGSIFVATGGLGAVVQYTPAGEKVRTFGDGGESGATGIMRTVQGIAVEAAGTILAADRDEDRLNRYAPNADLLWHLGSFGYGPGEFYGPQHLSNGPADTIWVTDRYSNRVQVLSGTGVPLEQIGQHDYSDDDLELPEGVAAAPGGTFYVTQTFDSRISHFSADGQRLARFAARGNGLVFAPDGFLYAASGGAIKLTPTGQVVQEFQPPPDVDVAASDVAVDTSGHVFVSSTFEDGVYHWAPSGEFVNSFGASPFFMDDAEGLDVDSAGNVFVADTLHHRIHVFTPEGDLLATFAGRDFHGNPLTTPYDVLVDPNRVLIIEEHLHHRIVEAKLDTELLSGPEGPTTDATPTFEFEATAGEQFECSLDGVPIDSCASPLQLGPLADGDHVLEVQAFVGSDWRDLTPLTVHFSVDTQIPDTAIVSPPPPPEERQPTFSFAATEAGSSFECAIDAEPFAACSGPGATHRPPPLANGPHTFRVRARDAAGNVDPSPAEQAFTTDAEDEGEPPGGGGPPPGGEPSDQAPRTPPETAITDRPPKHQFTKRARARARIGFSSDVPNASFWCRLDDRRWHLVGSPWRHRLQPGWHRFSVFAVRDGLADPTPATWRWKVHSRAP